MGKEENAVKRSIFIYLQYAGFEEWQYWRNQTAAVKLESGKYIHIGKSGLPDISLLLPDGKTFYIETKKYDRKKTAENRLSEKQIRFRNYCIKTNTPYLVTDHVQQVSDYLKNYFKGTEFEKRYKYF